MFEVLDALDTAAVAIGPLAAGVWTFWSVPKPEYTAIWISRWTSRCSDRLTCVLGLSSSESRLDLAAVAGDRIAAPVQHWR